MSRSHDVKYVCPYCGKAFEITVYDAVNAEIDKDLRDRCLSGEIFQQTCPHCRKEFLVQNELLYTDPYHKFVIFVSQQPVPKAVSAMVGGPLVKKGYKLRRCSTVKEFTEKIAVLEDEVDDIQVELAKYDSFIEFVDNKKGTAQDITSVDYERCENGVMKINVRTHDRGMAFLIPLTMLEEEIDASSESFKVDSEEFALVNSTWILSLFQKPQGQA